MGCVEWERFTGFWIRAERSSVELGTLLNLTIQSRPVLKQATVTSLPNILFSLLVQYRISQEIRQS
jgi:hypothetical protein